MSSSRRTATTAGILFLLTEITAIAGLLLYRPLLHDPGYVLAPGPDTRALLGAACELLLVAAVTGTAVTLYPVLRRRHEGLALAHLCARLLEAAVITIGILAVLAVVTLHGTAAGDPDATLAVARALTAVHDWTFLLGPNLALGANTLLLAWLLHRARLVPRAITGLGLVGGPLIGVSGLCVLFGLYPQVSAPGSLAALPVFAWEVALAVRLLTKGFSPAILAR
ncbi:DUF4386 domain-containing protein [Streptomyces sp. WAC06614]|uniref:DUF4386 domain-containing protein n=1 Tax=Streptomyces sp. WAC06614 TaxID=2487416 RepID=UPI000F7774A3|nr:DUF4386 domain-containing protein [Streptomyces sp. WAC06614]RSS83541.1 DUF4386 domain-containing protein [Streptomyces sp. WAC06614]